MPESLTFKDCMDKKTLIIGDVGTGKTKMMLVLLGDAIMNVLHRDITVIDLAPKMKTVGDRKVGGKLSEYMVLPSEMRYLAPERVEMPRLSAMNAESLLLMAKSNHEAMVPLAETFLNNLTPVLFVNDVSMYFQAGSPDKMLEIADISETFVGNGYYGTYFVFDFETGLSKRERDCMDYLAARMDRTIRIQEGS